jgi:hypothetical protein
MILSLMHYLPLLWFVDYTIKALQLVNGFFEGEKGMLLRLDCE